MDIYIKPVKKTRIKSGNQVLIKDIAEVIAPNSCRKDIEALIVLQKNGNTVIYLVSIMDIIKKILKKYPDCTVNNLGEDEIIVEFKPDTTENKLFQWAKIFFIVCVLLTGASSAIMSFHSDAQMYKVFENYNKIFFGVEDQKPYIILIPYSIGIAAGIIGFFNHFGGKKITGDPTPIEVQMTMYESDVDDTIIDNLGVADEDAQSKGGKF